MELSGGDLRWVYAGPAFWTVLAAFLPLRGWLGVRRTLNNRLRTGTDKGNLTV